MNDNLPEINFKEKKEKKGGALGWLRGKLGMGSRGAIGEAGINPAAMNAGRAALGAGKFGASSSGIAGLLAGKMGMIATVAMVAVASGVYLANNAPAPNTSTSAFSSNRSADNYVPAILRSQAANNGSSLDMFKETNKGNGMAMEGDGAKPAKAADAKPVDAAADAQAGDPGAPGADGAGMAQEMMGKLQGGSMGGSLTSQLGGGSSKFSNMGGFGNKFGSGATGAKTGFSSGIGSGFSSMPKFDSRKGKMLAMKGAARPVFGGSKSGKKGAISAGAFGQAKGMRAIQKSFTGSSIDGARSTQDKAWEGSTGEGDASGSGAGLSDGGAGIVTSPSIDNAGSGGGGGGTGAADEPVVPDVTGKTDASPWAGLPQQILMLITISLILSAIASYLISIGKGTGPFAAIFLAIGYVLAALALAAALYAMVLGFQIMGKHGQALLGTLYVVGSGCAVGAAILAFAGSPANNGMQLAFSAMAAVAVLIGSMMGGK